MTRAMWRLLRRSGQSRAAERLRRCVSLDLSPHTPPEAVEVMANFMDEAGDSTGAVDLVDKFFHLYFDCGNRKAALQCCFVQIGHFISKADLATAIRWLREARRTYVRALGPVCRADLFAHVGHVAYATNQRYSLALRAHANAARLYCHYGSLAQQRDGYVQYAISAS